MKLFSLGNLAIVLAIVVLIMVASSAISRYRARVTYRNAMQAQNTMQED